MGFFFHFFGFVLGMRFHVKRSSKSPSQITPGEASAWAETLAGDRAETLAGDRALTQVSTLAGDLASVEDLASIFARAGHMASVLAWIWDMALWFFSRPLRLHCEFL